MVEKGNREKLLTCWRKAVASQAQQLHGVVEVIREIRSVERCCKEGWTVGLWLPEERRICREMSGAFSQPRHRCFGKMLRSLADPVVLVEERKRSSSNLLLSRKERSEVEQSAKTSPKPHQNQLNARHTHHTQSNTDNVVTKNQRNPIQTNA